MKELLSYVIIIFVAAIVALGAESLYHAVNNVEVVQQVVTQCHSGQMYADYKF